MPSGPPLVLVVEDSTTIRAFVAEALRLGGYEVVGAIDGNDGVAQFRSRRPDVVVLDVNMPGLDGWQVLEKIREHDEHIPVLMLTAQDSEPSKVRGLVAGADDYLVKPVGMAELRARVGALMRRSRLINDSAPPEVVDEESAAPANYGDDRISIDHAARRVEVDGREVSLTPVEFRLLCVFTEHRGQVLSRQDLLEKVWDDVAGSSGGDQVKVYVGYLRKKLGDEEGKLIETVRGFGYRFPGSG